jgi:hypothetical protein
VVGAKIKQRFRKHMACLAIHAITDLGYRVLVSLERCSHYLVGYLVQCLAVLGTLESHVKRVAPGFSLARTAVLVSRFKGHVETWLSD